MDIYAVRRIAPLVYGLAVVVSAFAGGTVLVVVCVVGAMLLGLLYSLPALRGGRPGRVRQRNR